MTDTVLNPVKEFLILSVASHASRDALVSRVTATVNGVRPYGNAKPQLVPDFSNLYCTIITFYWKLILLEKKVTVVLFFLQL